MKLLKWAIGGASAYVVYRYSIGRKAKGEDVFVTPEKAVERIVAEGGPVRKRAPRKTAQQTPVDVAAPAVAEQTAQPGPKTKRKRAPRKVTAPE